MEPTMKVRAPTDGPIKVMKWKVRKGYRISHGSLLCTYESEKGKNLKLKSVDVGTVADIYVKEGEETPSGSLLLEIQSCTHPTVMKDMCAECGANLRDHSRRDPSRFINYSRSQFYSASSLRHNIANRRVPHSDHYPDSEPASPFSIPFMLSAKQGSRNYREQGHAGERNIQAAASVAMVHSIPELIVSESEALELGKADENRLLKTRKLVLLVDLDQTLIHTTNDNIPPNLKDVYHFQLYAHGNVLLWYHTRLRPRTQEFLDKISKLYELHICTFGVRMYAHTIAKFLDPDGKYFSHRILSRDECFNQSSKTANLKALFPCGDSMVCIIDDREDVWNFSPNLIHVKPYRFFQGTADINAPIGLAKTENDDQPITHRVRKISRSESKTEHETAVKENPADGDSENDIKSETDTKDTVLTKDVQNNNKNENDQSKHNDEKDQSEHKDETVQSQDCKNGQSETKSENQVDGSEKQVSVDEEHGSKQGQQNSEGSSKEKLSEQMTDKTAEKLSNQGSEIKTESCGLSSANVSHSSGEEKDLNSGTKIENSDNLPNKKCLNEETKEKETITEKENEKGKTEDNKTEIEAADNEVVEIEWDDEDDYLLHLEEILTRIHTAFYDLYDQMKTKLEPVNSDKPDLKNIIPYVKRKVLKGTNIVFSGVVPTNMPPEKSRAFVVAKALGANIQTCFVPKSEGQDATTHLVAARLGTAKVREVQKAKHVRIVNPDWLWSCAERWEKVEEKLFPLTKDMSPSCDSPVGAAMIRPKLEKRKLDATLSDSVTNSKRPRKNNEGQSDSDNMDTSSSSQIDSPPDENVGGSKSEGEKIKSKDRESRFSVSYNPLYSFSDDDIACMDKEVEDLMDEDGNESEEDEEERDSRIRSVVLSSSSGNDESSEDSMSGDSPRGWKAKKTKSKSHGSHSSGSSDHKEKHENSQDDSENELESFEKTMDAFSPDSESEGESIGSVDDELADAVEKEFLASL